MIAWRFGICLGLMMAWGCSGGESNTRGACDPGWWNEGGECRQLCNEDRDCGDLRLQCGPNGYCAQVTCAQTPCFEGVTCTDSNVGYSCGDCPTGFSGDGITCTQIDACSAGTDNCHPEATCTSSAAGFSCTCNAGYSGNGVLCQDNNECQDDSATCSTNATCTNTPGGFRCDCKTGFNGDGFTCLDIDECANGSATCDVRATCANTEGGFTCTCKTGYTGQGGEGECSCVPGATEVHTCEAGHVATGIFDQPADFNTDGVGPRIDHHASAQRVGSEYYCDQSCAAETYLSYGPYLPTPTTAGKGYECGWVVKIKGWESGSPDDVVLVADVHHAVYDGGRVGDVLEIKRSDFHGEDTYQIFRKYFENPTAGSLECRLKADSLDADTQIWHRSTHINYVGPSMPVYQYFNDNGSGPATPVCVRLQVQEGGEWGRPGETRCRPYGNETYIRPVFFYNETEFQTEGSIDAFRWWRVEEDDPTTGCMVIEFPTSRFLADGQPHSLAVMEETLTDTCASRGGIVSPIATEEARSALWTCEGDETLRGPTCAPRPCSPKVLSDAGGPLRGYVGESGGVLCNTGTTGGQGWTCGSDGVFTGGATCVSE
ncbi:MAG: calcium-binding EGF-like domain-containing protein [Myxococcota bacterium]|nr:calcium-binding EGF-like domain-containing protein [Myxococcota bacterium]